MDICIVVRSCVPLASTDQVEVAASIGTTAGADIAVNIILDFVASPQQTNATVIAAAKQALVDQLGVVLDGSERVLLFGGRV